MHWLKWPARIFIAIGCACIAAVGIRMVEAASFQQMAGAALDQELSQAPEPELIAPTPAAVSGHNDARPPAMKNLIGRLEIPRLRVSVIVMEGEDDGTLARAVGHLRGTALPWESGNAVLAGHRDTFFRPLRNIRNGDEIRMTTARGTFNYRVTSTEIVEPDDLSVLAAMPDQSLTLVTCYPFAYVGHAPQRFIVHAR
jgi:sortase A